MDGYARGGLTFEVDDTGPADGPVVLLLHGFPQDRRCWAGMAPPLAGAGYRVVAPDQRGYSPGARPDGRRSYRVEELVADALALAGAAGAERFHVVGHDWGAAVAWALGARHPDRVASVTALSVPHPAAFLRSALRGSQLLRSWYMFFFQAPALPEAVLSSRRGATLAAMLERSGLGAGHAARYAERASDQAALTGPLNWYRALPFGAGRPLPKVSVPALFVYGAGDTAVTRAAADGCGAWVSGPYRYEVVAGGGHWLPENRPEETTDLVLEHLARWR